MKYNYNGLVVDIDYDKEYTLDELSKIDNAFAEGLEYRCVHSLYELYIKGNFYRTNNRGIRDERNNQNFCSRGGDIVLFKLITPLPLSITEQNTQLNECNTTSELQTEENDIVLPLHDLKRIREAYEQLSNYVCTFSGDDFIDTRIKLDKVLSSMYHISHRMYNKVGDLVAPVKEILEVGDEVVFKEGVLDDFPHTGLRYDKPYTRTSISKLTTETTRKLDMDKMIVCIRGEDKYVLLPIIAKGNYTITGYNWFNLETNTYNSCRTWETKEEAIKAYSSDTAVFKNIDLMYCLQ